MRKEFNLLSHLTQISWYFSAVLLQPGRHIFGFWAWKLVNDVGNIIVYNSSVFIKVSCVILEIVRHLFFRTMPISCLQCQDNFLMQLLRVFCLQKCRLVSIKLLFFEGSAWLNQEQNDKRKGPIAMSEEIPKFEFINIFVRTLVGWLYHLYALQSFK